MLIAALIVAELAGAFETSMVYAALPKLLRAYGDPISVGWVVTIYLLVSAGVAAVAGRLGDIYGRRRLLLVVLAIASVGSAISAATDTLAILVLGRGLQGAAGAVLPLCFGIVREAMAPRLVTLGVGAITAAASVGVAVGLLIGGVIVDGAGWRFIFVASGLSNVTAFVAVLAVVPSSRMLGRDGPPDLLGGALFVSAVAALLLLVSNGPRWGLFDLRLAALAIGCATLFAAWFTRSLRHPTPLLDVRLFLRRDLLLLNGCMAMAALGPMQTIQINTMILQQSPTTGVGLGISATLAGALLLPANLTSLLSAPYSGYLIGRLGGRAVLMIGAALLIVAWFALVLAHSDARTIMALACCASVGLIVVYTALFGQIVLDAPADRTSEATGMLAVVRAVFMAIGAQLLVVLLATDTVSDPANAVRRLPSGHAYTVGLLAISACSLCVLLVARNLPARGTGSGRRATEKREFLEETS